MLLNQVINSFCSTQHIYAMADICKRGPPLGNLTSQLLVNIYMNKFDQYIKHKLKMKYYIRYADDFLILSPDKSTLLHNVRYIECYINNRLKLSIHPDKVFIKTLASGVDFLGWVHFPGHRVLRAVTKRRMFKKLSVNFSHESLTSYQGLLKYGNTYKLRRILNESFK